MDTIFEEEQNHEDIDPPPKNIVELGNASDESVDEDSIVINFGTSGQASILSFFFLEKLDTFYALIGGVTFTNAVRNTTKKGLQFQPLLVLRPRPRRRQAMNPPNQPLQNPKVRSAKLKGKPKEDPDCHVAQFQTR